MRQAQAEIFISNTMLATSSAITAHCRRMVLSDNNWILWRRILPVRFHRAGLTAHAAGAICGSSVPSAGLLFSGCAARHASPVARPSSAPGKAWPLPTNPVPGRAGRPLAFNVEQGFLQHHELRLDFHAEPARGLEQPQQGGQRKCL